MMGLPNGVVYASGLLGLGPTRTEGFPSGFLIFPKPSECLSC